MSGHPRRKQARKSQTKLRTTPPWVRYRDGSVRDEQTITVDSECKVYQSLWRDGHTLSDFVLIESIKVGSRWRQIVKVDCCHHEVHAHHFKQDGTERREVLKEVQSQSDLLEGLEMATNLVYDRVERNKRRWRRGK